MPFDFKGKKVLVTFAGREMGRALAIGLSQSGLVNNVTISGHDYSVVKRDRVLGRCDSMTAVPTGKRHSGGDITGPTHIYDINTKMAAGVGHSQINSILAELNLPPTCHKTLKKREREIGDTIEAAVEESCDQAIVDELELLQYLSSQASNEQTYTKEILEGATYQTAVDRVMNAPDVTPIPEPLIDPGPEIFIDSSPRNLVCLDLETTGGGIYD